MTQSAQRVYAGETAEQRVSRRRAALIDQAIALVGEHGWRQLSAERVCELAGLNKRYFYESFTDVDALAAAMIDELAAELLALVVTDPLAVSLPQLVRTMVEKLVAHCVEHPDRARVLFGELAGSEAATRQRRLAIRQIVAIVAGDARLVAHADHPMADVLASILVNGSIRTLVDWLDGHLPLTREQLVDETTASWVISIEGAIAHISASSADSA